MDLLDGVAGGEGPKWWLTLVNARSGGAIIAVLPFF